MVKTKTEIEEKIKQYIQILKKHIKVNLVVLYGSYADENPNPYSDIDLAIFSGDFGKDRLREMRLLSRLTLEVDVDIEPIAFSYDEYLDHSDADFVAEILNKGKIVYRE